MRNYYVSPDAMARVGAAPNALEEWRAEHPTAAMVWSAATFAGVTLGAYHGYRRNDSVGWAVAWALTGGLFPFITLPVMFAQGFAKRA